MSNILRRAHQNLAVFDTWSRAMIIASQVAHFDESGLRVAKQFH